MQIEALLHLRGSEMDLYSPDFFLRDGVAQDPLGFEGGLILAYGKVYDPKDKDYTKLVCLNLGAFVKDNGDFVYPEHTNPIEVISSYLLNLNDQGAIADYLVEKPIVPPSHWWINEEDKEPCISLAAKWLNKYKSPTYWNITNSFRKVSWIRLDNSDAYMLSSVGNTTKVQNTIAFVNGLAFRPTIGSGSVTFEGVKSFIDARGRTDVDRGVVIIDFTNLGGCTFYNLSELEGNRFMFTLPEAVDLTTQSILLFVDGRFILPEEYKIVDGRIVYDLSKWKALYTLDKKYASAQFLENTRIVEAETTKDLRSLPNSFLCVVNTPNLQVYQHESVHHVNVEKVWNCGVPAKFNRFQNDFPSCARGLMFDLATKSVTDYTKATETATFYAAELGALSKRSVSKTYVNLSKPLVLFANQRDNLMSARGCAYDDLRIGSTDTIIWPKYVVLDFVFRG